MKYYLHSIFEKLSGKLTYLEDQSISFEVPNNSDFGDYSTNTAMLLTKVLKKNPRIIAQEIIDNLEYDDSIVIKIEIAGPGFINFYFSNDYKSKVIINILDKKENFGRTLPYSGKKANVEFVSANPTGPLTVGHGRNAVLGDTVSRLLEWLGYSVDREYYFNNAGRQMRILGESVKFRYLQLIGKDVDFPETHYQGEYINDIAKELQFEFNDTLIDEDAEGIFKDRAESVLFKDIKNSLNRLNIKHEIFYNEKELYEEKHIDILLSKFKELDLVYEKDGASWLKLSSLKEGNDKVIIKSTGEPTYRLPDIAYHIEKLKRDYDLLVDVFGSDHIATYPDVIAALKALDYDSEKIKVIIYQFVSVIQNGEEVKMSTRKANFVTLDWLLDEVGNDVVRYFYLMRNAGSHMTFDLDLAKKQNDENPVFYLQYAHARICSILEVIKKESIAPNIEHLNLLTSKEEIQLISLLNNYETEINKAAELLEPHRICTYLEELAAAFHKFYTFSRILGSEKNLADARAALALAAKILLSNGLSLIGINAPERM